MLLRIPRLLNDDEITVLRDLATRGTFVDGRDTAGERLHEAKLNEQLKLTRDQATLLNETFKKAMGRNPTLQFFAWPRRVNTPMISRYTPGMEYGSHFDNPIMFDRQGEPMRPDLSVTVFLSDVKSYDGGALSLDTPFGTQTIRLAAGSAVVYATTMRHRVTPVTRGTRLAAVTWIQSLVKDHEKRQILFDLAQARQAISESSDQASELLGKGFTSLVKMWAEV